MPDRLLLLKDKDEPNLAYEVTDLENRLLMAMPLSAIRRQKLYFRLVCLALRGHRQDDQKKNNPKTVFLLKRPRQRGHKTTSLLGLYLEPVLAGEATEGTALRAIHRVVPLPGLEPQLQAVTSPSKTIWTKTALASKATAETALEHAGLGYWLGAHCYFYTLDLPGNMPPEDKNCQLAVDQDELAGLAQSAPETLGPELLWAQQAGILFD